MQYRVVLESYLACFISPRNRPHDIKTRQITTPAHQHHGTAEGSFTAKKWFGHRAGRSPCAHSIGKFFPCYTPLFFLLKLPPPARPGTTCINIFSYIFHSLGRLVDTGGPAIVEIQGSAAWAVALQSGSAVLRRRPSHLWL